MFAVNLGDTDNACDKYLAFLNFKPKLVHKLVAVNGLKLTLDMHPWLGLAFHHVF